MRPRYHCNNWNPRMAQLVPGRLNAEGRRTMTRRRPPGSSAPRINDWQRGRIQWTFGGGLC